MSDEEAYESDHRFADHLAARRAAEYADHVSGQQAEQYAHEMTRQQAHGVVEDLIVTLVDIAGQYHDVRIADAIDNLTNIVIPCLQP